MSDPISIVRSHAESGDLDAAIAAFESVRALPLRGGSRVLRIALALDCGLVEDARADLSRGLAEAPDDPGLQAEAESLTAWLGEDAAGAPQSTGVDAKPSTSAVGVPGPSSQRLAPPTQVPPEVDGASTALTGATDADLVRFVHLFAGREGVHARQWIDRDESGAVRRVGYSPIEGPLTPSRVASHLSGRETLGVYVIRVDDTVTFFAVDLDLTRRALDQARRDPAEARRLRGLLATETRRILAIGRHLGLELVPEDSGFKGRHFWGFLETPLPADLIHRFGTRLRRAVQPEDGALAVEFFPKQRRVEAGGLGNLVKLPLGVHRRSGRRARLLDEAGAPLTDPWSVIRKPPCIGREALLSALSALRAGERVDHLRAEPETGSPRTTRRDPGRRGPEQSGPERTGDRSPDALEPRALRKQPQIAHLETGCPVLRTLIDRAMATRRVTYDEQMVLRHVLGHLDAGVDLVNGLFERCPEVAPHTFLKRTLRGHPISCARIRERIPQVTAGLPCHCAFDISESRYPTPLLHVEGAY